MTGKSIIKILIVDDHPIVRQGLIQIIEREDDLRICCEAESPNEAIAQLSKHEHNLAIIDISLADNTNGLDLVKAIKERYPNLKTLVLSMFDESLYAERAIRAGSRGYIMKKEASKNIVSAIRTIANGELYLSEKISSVIIDKLIHGSSDTISTPVDVLGDREFEVFQLVGNGFGSREIARKMNISINTVESHRRHIKEKLKVSSGGELVKQAVQWVLMNAK